MGFDIDLTLYSVVGVFTKSVKRSIKKGIMDLDEFLDNHYDLSDNSHLLVPDDELIELMKNTKATKWVLTNAFEEHAVKILKMLGLTHFFDVIISANHRNSTITCKPFEEAYTFVEKLSKLEDVSRIHFFDDKPRNIESAVKRRWNGHLITGQKTIKS